MIFDIKFSNESSKHSSKFRRMGTQNALEKGEGNIEASVTKTAQNKFKVS